MRPLPEKCKKCIIAMMDSDLRDENKRLRDAIEGALRIKALWFHQSEKEEHREESKALATMLTSFEQALAKEK